MLEGEDAEGSLQGVVGKWMHGEDKVIDGRASLAYYAKLSADRSSSEKPDCAILGRGLV